MEIIDIFERRLSSFKYEESDNEFDRLMELWTDVSYLRNFALENSVANVDRFVERISEDAERLQDLLDDIVENDRPLEEYFRPLHDSEINIRELSLQKGKTSHRDGLRIYAIRIDVDCFVITGGAIKMSQSMQEHPDTNNELSKLKRAQAFLKDNGVFDIDSFFELKNEIS